MSDHYDPFATNDDWGSFFAYGLYVYLYCMPHFNCPEWAKVRYREFMKGKEWVK